MKRIIMHWTAGQYKASDVDKQHYHYIYEGDGRCVAGNHKISDNAAPMKPNNYAAHTLNCNSDSIGISMACMLGAVEGKSNGQFPMTEVQFMAMCKGVAALCNQYGIRVSPTTVLSHAEVQGNLGIKQRGKWDFTVLPFNPGFKGAKACGDYARHCILEYLYTGEDEVQIEPATAVKVNTVKTAQPKLTLWQRLCQFFGAKA